MFRDTIERIADAFAQTYDTEICAVLIEGGDVMILGNMCPACAAELLAAALRSAPAQKHDEPLQ